MKHLHALLLLCSLFITTGTWVSCDIFDDVIVDWAPVEIYITVQDASGHDLLDSLSNHCVLDCITATFQGETYQVRTDCYMSEEYGILKPYEYATRAYMPSWYGLCLINHVYAWNGVKNEVKKTDHYMLYFGEISGAADMDEDIIISFPGGEEHIIHYHCSNHNERKITCKRWFSLDGKKTDSCRFNIVI